MKRFTRLILALLLTAMPLTALAAGGSCPAMSPCMDPGEDHPGKHGPGCRGDHAALNAYAALTGKPVESLRKTCEEGKMTVWELAKKEGKLDALKNKILTARTASLDALVQGGLMTQEERDKILSHMTDELNKK